MAFIVLNTNHFRNYIESETNIKVLLRKSFCHLSTKSRFKLRTQLIVCCNFIYNSLMDHEAIEPMPNYYVFQLDTMPWPDTQANIICQHQILCILIKFLATEFNHLFDLFARSFTKKSFYHWPTNCSKMFVWFINWMNSLLCFGQSIKSANTTRKKFKKIFRMNSENKSKFDCVVLPETLQTEKFVGRSNGFWFSFVFI